MRTYLITPMNMLGSDSFYVMADSHALAIEKAQLKIKAEDWHSPMGWTCFMQITDFEDTNT
jgi:hypothetical protein